MLGLWSNVRLKAGRRVAGLELRLILNHNLKQDKSLSIQFENDHLFFRQLSPTTKLSSWLENLLVYQ